MKKFTEDHRSSRISPPSPDGSAAAMTVAFTAKGINEGRHRHPAPVLHQRMTDDLAVRRELTSRPS